MSKNIIIALLVLTVTGLGIFIFLRGGERIPSNRSEQVTKQVLDSSSGYKLLAVYKTGTSPSSYLEVKIIDPVSDTLLFGKSISLSNSMVISKMNNGLQYVSYDEANRKLYVKTEGNLVEDTSFCGPNAYECDSQPICPSQGECFDFSISEFSLNDNAQSVTVYKHLINHGASESDFTSYADKPYYSLLGYGNTLYQEFPPQTNTYGPTEIAGIEVKVNYAVSDIFIRKGGIENMIPIGGTVDNIEYLVSPDKRYLFLTTKQYDSKKITDPIINPYVIGLEKVDITKMTSTEIAKNVFPESISSDGKYLFGIDRSSGTSVAPVLLDLVADKRQVLRSLPQLPRHGEYELAQWIK